MLIRFVAALAALCSTAALAQEQPQGVGIMSVSHLKEQCSAELSEATALKYGFCIGYVRAIFDPMYIEAVATYMAFPEDKPDPRKCIPSYMTNQIVITIIKNKLKQAKDEGEFASWFVRDAIKEAFPDCFA